MYHGESMAATEIVGRKPRLAGVALRILFFTFLVTLLAFALGLLAGIIATAIAAMVRKTPPEMTNAYRHIAFPLAMVVAAAALLIASLTEIRHYRHRRALWRGF
jgi:uncharacterized BrkB/YihY/UPF0761 family membrane protein